MQADPRGGMTLDDAFFPHDEDFRGLRGFLYSESIAQFHVLAAMAGSAPQDCLHAISRPDRRPDRAVTVYGFGSVNGGADVESGYLDSGGRQGRRYRTLRVHAVSSDRAWCSCPVTSHTSGTRFRQAMMPMSRCRP